VSDSGKSIVFTYPKETINKTYKVYSPVYVHLKIWLDVNGDKQLSTNEESFVEYVTFVYYPPIYVIPDPSTLRSIYLNGAQNKNLSMSSLPLDGYSLGSYSGVRDVNNNYHKKIERIGIPDEFIEQGSVKELQKLCKMDCESVKEKILRLKVD
jgi:1-deoxy-D-xylulose-5-phosphate synthase